MTQNVDHKICSKTIHLLPKRDRELDFPSFAVGQVSASLGPNLHQGAYSLAAFCNTWTCYAHDDVFLCGTFSVLLIIYICIRLRVILNNASISCVKIKMSVMSEWRYNIVVTTTSTYLIHFIIVIDVKISAMLFI